MNTPYDGSSSNGGNPDQGGRRTGLGFNPVELGRFKYLPYEKRSNLWLIPIFCLDILLWLIRWFGRQNAYSPVENSRRIVVAKPDHLGDMLMAVPSLRMLRSSAPLSEIILLSGSWCYGLASELKRQGIVDDVWTYNALALDRGGRTFKKAVVHIFRYATLAQKLSKSKVDWFIDLRPHSPNCLLLASLCRPKTIAGFGWRGLRDNLDIEFVYDHSAPIGQILLDAMAQVCRKARESYLGPAFGWRSGLGDPKKIIDRSYIVWHLDSVDVKRSLSFDAWFRYWESMSTGNRDLLHVIVGSSKDTKVQGLDGHILDIRGETSLAEVFGIVSAAKVVVAVDSFIAHVGLSTKRPTIVLEMVGATTRRSFPQCFTGFYDIGRGFTELDKWIQKLHSGSGEGGECREVKDRTVSADI